MHIYYFSGTGNTYTIANTIIESLRNHQPFAFYTETLFTEVL